MSTVVLGLATVPTAEGEGCALLALLPGGLIDLQLGPSWAAAAEVLASKLEGPVRCDATLETVGRRHGWRVGTPSEEQRLEGAAIALALAEALPPSGHSVTLAFCSAWVAFFRLGLWREVPPELSLRVLRREGKKSTEHALAILGQSGLEFGLVFYDDPAVFDAMWSGEQLPLDALSVLADEEPGLELAFRPFGVPPPRLTSIVRTRPRQAKLPHYLLAGAALQLLVNLTTGEPLCLPLGGGATLELKRDAPEKKKPAKRKKPKKK